MKKLLKCNKFLILIGLKYLKLNVMNIVLLNFIDKIQSKLHKNDIINYIKAFNC